MLLNLLRTPSAFENDPWGFLRNQIGHAGVFGALPAILCSQWGLWGLWVVLAYAFLIEATQILYFHAKEWDGMQDTSFVAQGWLVAWLTLLAVGVSGMWPLALMAWVVLVLNLAAGFTRRNTP
jgi:hypothetical protein